MTTLTWDQIGQRLFEAGIDRGVLYLSDDSGVAWNGLTGIDEDLSTVTSEPVYFDGVKVMDEPALGDFAAMLRAFTYPDEFLEYEGVVPTGDGFLVDNQGPKPFGLSFRTRVGNDIEGTDFGYRVHIVYNVTAVPDTKSYQTQTLESGPMDFSWNLTAVPEAAPGYRPTAHVILDSRFLPADILFDIETILYGSDGYFSGDIIYDGGDALSGSDLIDGGDSSYTSEGSIGDGTPDSSYSDADDVLDAEEPYYIFTETIDGGYAGDDGDPLPDGTHPSSDPRLPPMSELFNLITLYGPKIIVPHPINGVAQLIPGSEIGDVTQSGIAGVFTALPETRLSPSIYEGVYILSS